MGYRSACVCVSLPRPAFLSLKSINNFFKKNMGLSKDAKSGGYCVLRRDCCISLIGKEFSPSAQVPSPQLPTRSRQTPTWTEGPWGRRRSSGHVLCL